MKAAGGPTAEDRWLAGRSSGLVSLRGDVLLFGGPAVGDLFNRLAHAIAVSTFMPDGRPRLGGFLSFGWQFSAEDGVPVAQPTGDDPSGRH